MSTKLQKCWKTGFTYVDKTKIKTTSGLVVAHWLRNNSTIQYLGLWETLHNPDFNVTKFGNFKNKSKI